MVYYAIANSASWGWQRRILFTSLQMLAVVAMLRRWFAYTWPHFTWTHLCCQIFGVLAKGNEATLTLGIRVYYLFNLPEEGNYPAFPYRVVTCVLTLL